MFKALISLSTAFLMYLKAKRIGPAAGLLAAYSLDPSAYWVVVACDYPLMDAMELRRLRDAYEEPVTCFRNEEGFAEPLIGIWSPRALEQLKVNVSSGINGPNRVVRQMAGKMVRPRREKALFNANTPEDWQRALEMMKES